MVGQKRRYAQRAVRCLAASSDFVHFVSALGVAVACTDIAMAIDAGGETLAQQGVGLSPSSLVGVIAFAS
jgi:hypothetical protein